MALRVFIIFESFVAHSKNGVGFFSAVEWLTWLGRR